MSPKNNVDLAKVQRSYGSSSDELTAALEMQDDIMKHLKRTPTMQGDVPVDDINPIISDAVLHNLRRQHSECFWIELPDALQGPAHVAKILVQRCQQRRSTPRQDYRLNEEQLQCIALSSAAWRRPSSSAPIKKNRGCIQVTCL